MLAEIKGKISRTGSNLTDRLEDNLTGNVFGLLRYIPFSAGLGKVLANGVYPKTIGEDIRDIKTEFWADKINFWPYDREGEIDAIIEMEQIIIGIEVKYQSGLSSDDEITNDEGNIKAEEIQQSVNQLARESRIISRKSQDKKHKLLLFIADRNSCKKVYDDVSRRNIIENGITFGYISWQDFLYQLENLQVTNSFHQVIIQDLIALLIKKGFKDFTSMLVEPSEQINESDYFKFDVKTKIEFGFEVNIPISEDQYYEF